MEWVLAYPDRVESAIIIASAARLSDQGIAFNAIARQAIATDPNFKNGNYYGDATYIPFWYKAFWKRGLLKMIKNDKYSALSMEFREVQIKRNPKCPIC